MVVCVVAIVQAESEKKRAAPIAAMVSPTVVFAATGAATAPMRACTVAVRQAPAIGLLGAGEVKTSEVGAPPAAPPAVLPPAVAPPAVAPPAVAPPAVAPPAVAPPAVP